MPKEYRIPKNIKPQDLVRGIINASFWHWNTIDKTQHTEAITYLNNLEAIDNAKPSEALECLKKIVDKGRINAGNCCHWRECLSKNKCILHNNDLMCDDYTRANTIKNYILKSQEQEKVLEIIKKKTVGIFQLSCCKNVYEYNDLKFNDYEKLTQEEFELLKKWQSKRWE